MEGSDMLKYVLILFLALVLVFVFMKLYNDQTPTVIKEVEKDNSPQKINVNVNGKIPIVNKDKKADEGKETKSDEAKEGKDDVPEVKPEEFYGFEGYENNSQGGAQSGVMGFSDNGDFGDVLAPVPRSENSPEVSLKTCDLNKVSPEELLPSNNTEFNRLNPNVTNSLENKNFLEAGSHIGLDTVGQSLRNASHDLRSEPPNPQQNVSPWLNTTIQPDLARRPLC